MGRTFPSTDHGGRRIIPAFVDSHCHILPTGLDLLKLHLGPAATRDEVLDLVRERHREAPEGWLHAVHYDQNKYGAHLTRHDLDTVSSERPILLRHVNGHASVANTAALRAAGVDASTPDPAGGEYLRDAEGPNGVLLEDAHEFVTSAAPAPDLEEMVAAILRAGASMRALGIDCATDMMTGRWDLPMELEAYRLAAERGCAVDLRLCLQWRPFLGPKAMAREALEPYLAPQNPKIIGAEAVRRRGVRVGDGGDLWRLQRGGAGGQALHLPRDADGLAGDLGATDLPARAARSRWFGWRRRRGSRWRSTRSGTTRWTSFWTPSRRARIPGTGWSTR